MKKLSPAPISTALRRDVHKSPSGTNSGLSGDSQTDTLFKFAPMNSQPSSETPRLRSNWDTHMYGELFAAITKMADLPDGNELHLDRVAAERAIAVLSFIKEHTRVSAPKLMNQDNEAVVFTWNFGDLKRYLTVAEDEVDVMFLHKPRQFRCEEVLTHGGELDYPKLMKSIDPEPKSSSTIEG